MSALAGGSADVTSVRAACTVGAALWVGLHVTLGLLYLEHADHLAAYLVALGLLLVGTVIALYPLWSRGPRTGAATAALVVLPSLIETVNVGSLESGAVVGYANWAAGAVGVMLASLVLAGHGWLGCLSGAGVIVSEVTAYVLDPPPGGASLVAAVVVSVPPQLWLLGAWAVRRVLASAEDVAHDYRSRAEVEAATGDEQSVHLQVRSERLRELEADVLPFLTSVAAGTTIDEGMAHRAEVLSAILRDSLRARALLDATVRDVVARLRHNGVHVLLSSDSEGGDLVDAVRTALPSFLTQPGLTSLVMRVTEAPPVATVIIEYDGEATGREIAAASLPDRFTATTTDLGSTLIIEITPRDVSPS